MSPDVRELAYPGDLAAGSSGPGVRRVQEWLTHHGYALHCDGAWGPATTAALGALQHARELPVGPVLTVETWDALVAPLRRAAAPVVLPGGMLGAAALAVARLYLRERPREIGGANRGPWVRHLTAGAEVAWCAGFVRTVLRQAAASLGQHAPGWTSLSVATMADLAAARGLEVDHRDVKPGNVFFWTHQGHGHTGLVVELQGGSLGTVEGNTDPGGSREGDGVYGRRRAVAGLRFIRV